MIRRRSVLPAAAVGVSVFVLYLLTLAPGLLASEDTPKFQFIGHILGTAHTPGYPLYVVVSHVFGWLPVGNLAWRMNLLSACCAAFSVMLLTQTLVASGVSRIVAMLAGLGLATGAAFWAMSIVAEVYALHVCLIAGMTFALVRWQNTGRPLWFFAAIALFSLGLGHHTSIVVTGPAVALFAIATAPRFALSPKTIGAILLLFAAGFSQYLFILIRTRQGAWGESPASNLSELVGVIRGSKWASYVAPVTLQTIADRGPAILHVIATQVTLPVLLVAAAGMAVLVRRNRPLLMLSVFSSLGVIGFSIFFAGQTAAFLMPVYLFFWLLAATGLDGLLNATRLPGPWRGAVATAACGAIVVSLFSANLAANDLSHRWFDVRVFDALTTQLPMHSTLIAEDFVVDRMAKYKQLGEGAFAARDLDGMLDAAPARVTEAAAQSRSLFAFQKSAAALRRSGLAFDYQRWPLTYGPLRRFLDDQPSGTVVAFAVPALEAGAAFAHDAVPFDRIGLSSPPPVAANLAAIGVVRRRGGLQSSAAQALTSVYAARGLPIGTSQTLSPTDILAEAVYDRASIRIGSREIIRSHLPVVAIWDRAGRLVTAFAVGADGQVPMPDSPLNVYRYRGEASSAVLHETPLDITPYTASGHLMVKAVAAPVVIYAAYSRPLAPRLFELRPGETIAVREFTAGSGDLAVSLEKDAWRAPLSIAPARHVYRIEVPPSPDAIHLAFGGIPEWASACCGTPPNASLVYSLDLTRQLEPLDERTWRLHVARDHHEFFLGAGWSPVNGDEAGGFVISAAAESELLIPCDAGGCSTIDLQLWQTSDTETATLAINGQRRESQALRPGWNWYRWTIPENGVHVGINAVTVSASAPTMLADVLVARPTP